MDLIQFFRLFLRHATWIAMVAITLAATVFYLTKDEQRTYSSKGLVNTGLVAGYKIESQQGGKTDYFYASAELDNILNLISAYETIEELGLVLLAEVMAMKTPSEKVILKTNYEELRREIGAELWESVAVPGDLEKTKAQLTAYRNLKVEENPIRELLYGKHPLFGHKHLGGIKVAKEGKSDMIRLSYTTIDPGIAQRTLVLLIDIFRRKHREIKESQTGNVLGYFEEATAASAKRLRLAEERLKVFREKSKIINYYEQTRFIANKREDLYESYMTQLMNMVAADSALSTLEKQLNQRNLLGMVNRALLNKRDSLSAAVSQMAQLRLLKDDTLHVRPKIDSLREAITAYKRSLQSSRDSIQVIQRSPRGSELEDLLAEWLKNLLKMEDAAARLRVIENRKVEFEEIYDTYAPLGSTLKRLEREIDIAEREYLENLHSLNQARLHRQSMLMSTNLKVVDIPFFPAAPDPSQRIMLVIVAFLVGFMLPIALVIAMEFFDKTLKKPEWARRTTELEVIGVLPRLGQKKRYRSRVAEAFLEERPIGLMLQNLKIELAKKEKKRPLRLLILSTREQEGKTLVGYMLTKYLRKFRANVLFFTPGSTQDASDFPASISPLIGHRDTLYYNLKDDLFEMDSEEQLLADGQEILTDPEYYITELPGLLTRPYPVELIRKADLILLVARSNRTWVDADRHIMERIATITQSPIRLILNGVDVEYLEESLGELPKRRSWLRRYAKRYLKAGFSSRSKL